MPDLRMDDDRLAAALADLGAHVAYPAAPDVRARVLTRISEPRRSEWWRVLASPRYGFAPALVTLALVLMAVFVFSPGARATATDILRLRGVEIFRGPVPTPTPTPMPSRSPSSIPSATADPLSLGQLVTFDDAKAGAGYPLVVPTDPLLGVADGIYIRSIEGSTAVSFAYRVRPGIPVSPQAGLSALVTEFGGHLEPAVLGKVVPPGTTLQLLTVNGGAGAWMEGQPHQVFYTSNGGASFITDTLRLAGNTLIWEQNGLVVRLEAQVDKATALRIAATIH